MPQFETELILHASGEEVFDFLARPANIVLLSPPDIGLTFVTAPEVIQLGSRIEFKIQSWGQIQAFVHEITALERPHHFSERQIKGVFKRWEHEHRLEFKAPNQVAVIDVIEFEPPAGLLGFLVTAPKILEQLEEAFDHRHQQLRKRFAS